MNHPSPLARRTPIRVDNHPFPVLLYLEWSLLAITCLSQLLPGALRDTLPLLRLLALGCTFGFGLMGLRLPTGALPSRIAYTGLEIVLMVFAGWFGGLRGLRLMPFFCVVLAIRSCLMFGSTGRVLITGLGYFFFLVALRERLSSVPNLQSLGVRQESVRPLIGIFAFNSALMLGLVLLFVLLLLNALMNERQSRESLTQAHEQLRHYALQVEKLAMEQERSRIAREIHDSLGHALTALNLQLEGALKLWRANPDRAHSFLKSAKTLGSTALQEVRQSVGTLRSDPLQGKPLPKAIQSLVESFERTTHIRPTCQIHLRQPLSPELAIGLYRIVQEALTNICKHANATQVNLEMQTLPTELYLQIEDNGRGFQPSQNSSGFGLQGIRERTLALGGKLDIRSAPNQGCQMTVHLPLKGVG